MKFSTVILTLSMAIASTQALSYDYAGAPPSRRSLDNYLKARSEAMLDFTTRELVQELESRMLEAREPVFGLKTISAAFHGAKTSITGRIVNHLTHGGQGAGAAGGVAAAPAGGMGAGGMDAPMDPNAAV